MIRVLMVDDHEIVRMGLNMLLETLEGYEIAGEAGNGREALMFLEKNEVDIILLDLMMPVMDGLAFMRKYAASGIKAPVVILTTLDDKEKIQEAIGLGAKSYLLKDASRDTLARTLHAALNDEMLLTRDIQEKLLSLDRASGDSAARNTFNLTEREAHLLTFVAKGDTNRAIAVEFDISERTVKAHLTSIYEKLGVASRSEAVAKALANKIIKV